MSSTRFAWLVFALLMGSAAGYAQSATDVPVDEIIRKFSEKEKEFRLARANYTYRQNVRVQELDYNGRVIGEYQQTAEVGFDNKGKRIEKIVYAPADTLRGFHMSPEDIQDLRDIQPFVLTSDEIGKYKLTFVGREKIDDVGCYAFDVEPRTIEKGQRYFQGKIWVDDRDFQIVKTFGKAVPDIRSKGDENLFPRFETYREQIDDYWFPTYTRANDTLNFSTGKKYLREIVRYENYKKFQADVKLIFGDEAEGKSQSSPDPKETKAPALDPKYKTDPKKK